MSGLERRTSAVDNTGTKRRLVAPPSSPRDQLGSSLTGPQSSTVAAEAATSPAMAPLLALQKKHPALRSDAHIHKATQPIEGIGPIPEADMDHFHVLKGKPGEKIALGTRGVSSCVALCARATTSLDEPVLGLGHLSNFADPKAALQAIQAAMEKEGAVDIEFHIVGGMLMRDANKNRLGHVDKLLEAAAELGIKITSAKIGTSESLAEEQDPGAPLLPSLGLAEKISTVVMPDKVVYCDENPHNTTILGGTRSLYAIDAFDSDEGIPLKVDQPRLG